MDRPVFFLLRIKPKKKRFRLVREGLLEEDGAENRCRENP